MNRDKGWNWHGGAGEGGEGDTIVCRSNSKEKDTLWLVLPSFLHFEEHFFGKKTILGFKVVVSRRKQHVDILRIWIPFEALPPPRERARQGWLPRLGRCSDYPSLPFLPSSQNYVSSEKRRRKEIFWKKAVGDAIHHVPEKRDSRSLLFRSHSCQKLRWEGGGGRERVGGPPSEE